LLQEVLGSWSVGTRVKLAQDSWAARPWEKVTQHECKQKADEEQAATPDHCDLPSESGIVYSRIGIQSQRHRNGGPRKIALGPLWLHE
jgi:hypothetical protein